MRTKLNEIVSWLNDNYSQESENYSIIHGAKPEVIRYDFDTVISLWACGAIVCIKSILYFIEEDDGNWFCHNYYSERDIDSDGCVQYRNYPKFGMQGNFSIGWVDSFTKAMIDLQAYIKENGTPVYYSGTDIVCHYTL